MKGYDDDEIEAAFKDLSVDDFILETSARHEIAFSKEDQEEVVSGYENWSAWIAAMRGMVKVMYMADISHGHQFVALSILHENTKQRMFTPDYDETIRNYVDRLIRESNVLHPTWAFSAILAPHAVYDGDASPPDIDMNSSEEIRLALEAGELEMGIFWFAERDDGTGKSKASGVIEFREGIPMVDIDADVDDEFNPFFGVLQGKKV